MRKVIALLPTTERRSIDAMLEWLDNSGEVDDVIVYDQGSEPIGASNARRKLLDDAYAAHGDEAIYLMLDNDCVFSEKSKIRWAASYYDEMEGLGIVCLPLDFDEVQDSYRTISRAHHCFLISGKIVAHGINYTNDEYCDEQDLSLQAYFAGFINIMTYRCAIMHHVTKMNALEDAGDTHNLIQESKIVMRSSFIKNFTGLCDFKTQSLYGVEIPVINSIQVTGDGKEIHSMNRRKLLEHGA